MSSVEEFWRKHLAAIEVEDITTKAYAEREGLSVHMLYQWRRQLRDTVVAKPSGFVAVQMPPAEPAPSTCCQLQIGHAVRMEFAALPDAHWLAALAAALIREERRHAPR
jgi:transposase-like protein